MSSDISNDNIQGKSPNGVDAHGQAALLLVESLVHGLIARDLITVADAVEIVDVAADVANDLDNAHADRRNSAGLLATVGDSLRGDLPLD